MKQEMICIGCPMGCQLSAELTETGTFVSVTGNTCKRGAEYARTECTDPRRMLTTTLRCADGGVVAVKTEQPIQKDRLMEAMKQLNRVVVSLPVAIGDVLVADVFGSRVVACQNRRGKCDQQEAGRVAMPAGDKYYTVT